MIGLQIVKEGTLGFAFSCFPGAGHAHIAAPHPCTLDLSLSVVATGVRQTRSRARAGRCASGPCWLRRFSRTRFGRSCWVMSGPVLWGACCALPPEPLGALRYLLPFHHHRLLMFRDDLNFTRRTKWATRLKAQNTSKGPKTLVCASRRMWLPGVGFTLTQTCPGQHRNRARYL